MRILTWNVNGYRSCLRKGFLEWLAGDRPDILCLQEVRVRPGELAEGERNPPGYTAYWNSGGRPGYSGTAVLARRPPISAANGIGSAEHDAEGRFQELDFGDFVLHNTYVPNGGQELDRVPFKLAFYDRWLKRVRKLHKAGRAVLLTGDWNTAHQPVDLARPRENETSTGFLPEERAWIDRFLAADLLDTFRAEFPGREGAYTWWSFRGGARRRNVGWRIDYFLASRTAAARLGGNVIHDQVPGSDHCPVEVSWT